MPGHHGGTCRHRYAVNEIAARDFAMHSQFPVLWIVHDLLRGAVQHFALSI
jgi:hypothetical protein